MTPPRKSPQQSVDQLIDYYVQRDPIGELATRRVIDVNLSSDELKRFAEKLGRSTWLYRGCELRQVLR